MKRGLSGVVPVRRHGRSAVEAAAMFAATAQYARELIHAFNAEAFAALDPQWSGATQDCLTQH